MFTSIALRPIRSATLFLAAAVAVVAAFVGAFTGAYFAVALTVAAVGDGANHRPVAANVRDAVDTVPAVPAVPLTRQAPVADVD